MDLYLHFCTVNMLTANMRMGLVRKGEQESDIRVIRLQ